MLRSSAAGPAVDWDVPVREWSSALGACVGATYFHTDDWLSALALTYGCRVVRVRFTWPDGHWALLALTIHPLLRGLLVIAWAGDGGVAGGLVASRALTSAELDAAYAHARRRYPLMRITGNPFSPWPTLPGRPARRGPSDATHTLALAPLCELRKGFSRGCKARGNKAAKQGLELVISSDPAAATDYYKLYTDNLARWGEQLTFTRPESYYRNMLAQSGGAARVFFALRNGEPVAALFCVSYGTVAHYLAGATRSDCMDLCPGNFLIERALEHYHARGFDLFDFGASGDMAGVVQFKESFGARPVNFGAAAFDSMVGGTYFALRGVRERLRA